MPAFFCPQCWNEVPEEAGRCPRCSADLRALDRERFEEKLRRALHHPEPLTAVRAASILGHLRRREAVPFLLRRYRSGADPYLGAAIAGALGRIGGPEAREAILELLSDRSVIVQRAARQALETGEP